jgi:hypothetical protein
MNWMGSVGDPALLDVASNKMIEAPSKTKGAAHRRRLSFLSVGILI